MRYTRQIGLAVLLAVVAMPARAAPLIEPQSDSVQVAANVVRVDVARVDVAPALADSLAALVRGDCGDSAAVAVVLGIETAQLVRAGPVGRYGRSYAIAAHRAQRTHATRLDSTLTRIVRDGRNDRQSSRRAPTGTRDAISSPALP